MNLDLLLGHRYPSLPRFPLSSKCLANFYRPWRSRSAGFSSFTSLTFSPSFDLFSIPKQCLRSSPRLRTSPHLSSILRTGLRDLASQIILQAGEPWSDACCIGSTDLCAEILAILLQVFLRPVQVEEKLYLLSTAQELNCLGPNDRTMACIKSLLTERLKLLLLENLQMPLSKPRYFHRQA